jgi:hypothetical protein
MVIAVVKALADWFRQWIIEIAVTDRRIIYKRGFINRVTAEMNMDKNRLTSPNPFWVAYSTTVQFM